MQESMERVVAGPERKSRIIKPSERKVIAFHEAGHAVVMHNLTHADPDRYASVDVQPPRVS